jgi:hypothetical protein
MEEGGILMKKAQLFLFAVLLLLAVVVVPLASAEPKSVELPKGTTVEKTPEGCLRFTLPGGCVVQVKGFVKNRGQAVVPGECGTIGDCGVFDGKGKLVATGKQGKILSGQKPDPAAQAEGDTLKLEGAVLYLPAVVQFDEARIFDRLTLQKLAPQSDAPGKGSR